ncbi:MAG: flippase-like domain-containing protein [Clostridia bacterium]|nr:flippase-like domain-containing protein [Clostridia bacterium]
MGGDGASKRPNQLKRGAAAAVGFSMLALFILMRLAGGREAWPSFARVNPIMLGICLGLMVLNWVFDSMRMVILVRSLGGRLSIWSGMRISILGAFVSNVTPFDSGGEPVQAYLLMDKGITVGQSSAVIAVKTIMNAFARMMLGLIIPGWMIVSQVQWRLPKGMDIALVVGLSLYFAVFAFFLFLIARPEKISIVVVPALRNRFTLRFLKPETVDDILQRINHGLHEFRESLSIFIRTAKPALAAVMGLSFACWIITILIPAVLLTGLGMRAPYAQVMGIAILFYLASAYAPTPGSSGAAELGFAALFSTIVPLNSLGVFVTLWRLITYWLTLGVGGILMAHGLPKRRSKGRRAKIEDNP